MNLKNRYVVLTSEQPKVTDFNIFINADSYQEALICYLNYCKESNDFIILYLCPNGCTLFEEQKYIETINLIIDEVMVY